VELSYFMYPITHTIE